MISDIELKIAIAILARGYFPNVSILGFQGIAVSVPILTVYCNFQIIW